MRTTAWAQTWSILRLVMAAVIVAAIVAQLSASLATAAELGRDIGTTLANFFSFFTILSNVVAAVALAWAGLWFFSRGRGASAEPPALAFVLAAATTYMLITGIVYNTLLRGIELPQGSEPIPWSNEVLHLVGPLFLLADLFVGPLRRALPFKAVLGVLAFPIAWVVYTLLRGPVVTNPATGDPFWYPYPFLNPNNEKLAPLTGYPGVALYVAGISLAFIIVGSVVVWWGRRRAATAELPPEPESAWAAPSA